MLYNIVIDCFLQGNNSTQAWAEGILNPKSIRRASLWKENISSPSDSRELCGKA
jgi:hypothetical protein